MNMLTWITLMLVVNEYIHICNLERGVREAGEEIKRLRQEIARLSS
jgi:hypothetical protein